MDNPYTPPKESLEIEEPVVSNLKLASRWSRLGASIIDSLIMMVFTLPVMYFTGAFDGMAEGAIQEQSLSYNLLMGLFGLVVFAAINLKFLLSSGQTIGKKALGIKIVDLEGHLPSLKGNLLKRYAVYFLPAQVPIAGAIFNMVNILFIFGNEKRCLHDYAGGTKVVNFS